MKVDKPFGTEFNQAVSKNTQSQKMDRAQANFSEILESARNIQENRADISISNSQLFNSMDFSPAQKDAISRSEEALTLLNHLADLLDGSTGSISSVDSAVSALDSNTEELLSLKENLEQGDPLRQTIDEIAVLTTVEKIKITRGDYS
ncbi:MAG: hypothetical protein GXO58_09245 [Thermodesulfobacteria bacterium]|nr:hypothetical protein [Thermodesulfobacteriota bacterium]